MFNCTMFRCAYFCSNMYVSSADISRIILNFISHQTALSRSMITQQKSYFLTAKHKRHTIYNLLRLFDCFHVILQHYTLLFTRVHLSNGNCGEVRNSLAIEIHTQKYDLKRPSSILALLLRGALNKADMGMYFSHLQLISQETHLKQQYSHRFNSRESGAHTS